MARSGIGATLASAALLSTLMIANYVLVLGEQGRMVAYSVADGESALYTDARLLEAASVLQYLGWVQGLLSSGELSCSTAASGIASAVAGHTIHLADNLVSADVGASEESTPVGASDVLLSPFDGFSPSSLNLRFHVYAFGVGADGSASYLSSRYEDVHLGAQLERASSLCLSAVEAISASLASLLRPGWRCNVTEIGSAVRAVSVPLSRYISHTGFGLSLSFATGPDCVVSYTVYVTQFVAQGPSGPFTLRLRQGVSIRL